jgi:hypothetical protein
MPVKGAPLPRIAGIPLCFLAKPCEMGIERVNGCQVGQRSVASADLSGRTGSAASSTYLKGAIDTPLPALAR